jgi:hypothetical protein
VGFRRFAEAALCCVVGVGGNGSVAPKPAHHAGEGKQGTGNRISVARCNNEDRLRYGGSPFRSRSSSHSTATGA